MEQRYNRLAVASALLGLAFLFGIGSILAIALGVVARRQVARDPGQKGAGLALAGIVMGIAWLAVFALVMAWLAHTG